MQAIIKTEAELINQPNIYEYYGHSTTWLLHKFANQKLQFWLPQFRRERRRKREKKEAKGMWLNKTMSGIYSTYDSRNCCQENFMNFDKARVCVWVCCVCVCLLARASKITIISGANTHTHIDRLWQNLIENCAKIPKGIENFSRNLNTLLA